MSNTVLHKMLRNSIMLLSRCILVGLSLNFACADIVPMENTCEVGTLHEVRVTDCSKMPCKIVRGREYKVEIDFTPSRNTTGASVKCITKLYGQVYNIPEEQICKDLTPVKCPLNNSTKYTYTVSFVVPYFIPPGPYPIRCGFLDDTKEQQICVNGTGVIF